MPFGCGWVLFALFILEGSARPASRKWQVGDSGNNPAYPNLTVSIVGPDPATRTLMVNVSWKQIVYGAPTDYIALFPAGTDPKAVAPIKLKQLPLATSGRAKGRAPAPHGTIQFKIINRRTNYYASYFGGNPRWPEEKARSPLFGFSNLEAPLGGHLALGSHEGKPAMTVMWNSKTVDDPVVHWGESPDDLGRKATPFLTATYRPEDMCDREIAPATRYGWLEPGHHYSVLLTDLVPGRQYFYSYGGGGGMSSVSSFKAPPLLGNGSGSPTRMYIFGDMGQSPYDNSSQHSWDFNDRGEVPARNVTRLLESHIEEGDLVLHIGDISYAVGYLSEWDQFMHQVEPVSRRVPWQTGIGNHEMGYSNSRFVGSDSGGECGVAYNVRFPFGQPGLDPSDHRYRPWYSFKYGRAHIVVTSTEHEFARGSIQHQWVVKDLASVDREATPWLIFTGHRPMYADWPGGQNVSNLLQDAYEYLFLEHRVDLCLWGHQHLYSRTCHVADGKCVSPGEGPVHMTIGMAGYVLSVGTTYPVAPPYIKYMNDTQYGVIRMDIPDAHSASIEFLTTSGIVADSFSLSR